MAAGSRAANLRDVRLACSIAKEPRAPAAQGRRVLDFGQARGQSFIKRVFGQKHIVPRRDGDMGGALRDQPIGERRGFLLRAIQGHASAARMKEPRGKNRLGFGEQRVLQTQEHGRDLAGGARLLLRRDAREDDTGVFARTSAPLRPQRCNEIGLRAQNRAVFENL